MDFLTQTQTGQGSQQESGEKCTSETVRIICECINTLLTDIPQVHNSLQKDKDESSQPHVVLQFLYHCVDQFPECYILRPSQDSSNNGPSSDYSARSSVAKDFTKWVISRIMRILASPECAALHAKSISVVDSILKLVRSRDLPFYVNVMKELVSLHEDMLLVSEDFFQNDSPEDFFHEVHYCSRFQTQYEQKEDCPYSMPVQMISLQDYSHCQHLMKASCILVKENTEYIQQFATSMDRTLFTLALRTIELSDMLLLFDAFQLMTTVIRLFPLLPPPCFDQYVAVVSTIVEYAALKNEHDACLMDELKRSVEVLSQRSNDGVTLHDLFLQKVVSSLAAVMKKDKHPLQDILLGVLAKFSTKHAEMVPSESLHTIVKLCVSTVGIKDLSKAAQKCLVELISAEGNEKFVSSTKNLIVHQMKELSNTILQADNNLGVWNAVSGLSIFLNTIIFCSTKEEIKYILSTVNFLSISDHILNLYWSQVFFTNLDTIARTRVITESLSFIINCCKLQLTDIPMNNNIIQKCLELSSVPWLLSIDPPWFDFAPKEYQQSKLIKLYHVLKPCLNPIIIGKCLKVLSFLGGRLNCPTWLVHIMRNVMGDQNSDIQLVALKHLVLFSQSLGTKYYGLLGDEILTMVHSSTIELQTKVASILGDLICMVSGKTVMKLEAGNLILVCNRCAAIRENEMQQEATGCSTYEGDIAELFKPFFLMIKLKSSIQCKKHILNAFENLLNHTGEAQFVSPSVMVIWTCFMDILHDKDFEIRFLLSTSLGRFLKAFDNVTIHQLAIDKLSSMFAKASEIHDMGVMETVILTMGDVGKAACGDIVAVMLVSLFNCFITQNKLPAAIAAEQIHAIAKAKKISCQQLFIDHKFQLCDIAVKKFQRLLEGNAEVSSVTDVFFNIGKLFEFPDVKAFLLATATEMLPQIVQLCSKHASIMIRLIAKYSQQNRREMMFYNFKYIFSYLVRHVGDENELEKCLRYLEEETDVELRSLLLSECQSVFNQLILYLSVNRDQVFQGFTILACNDASYAGPREFTSDADVAMFLHHRLLGVLAFFNSVLTNSPNYEKRIALKSILCLLKIVGRKYLTPVRLKVMAILKLTLRYKDDFPDLCCAAWEGFVRNIDIECLGPLLGQIVATLLPLLEMCADKVTAIFSFLVIENRNSMSPFFKDIYFIPDNPPLRKVKGIIEASHVKIKSLKDFRMQVESLVKGIAGENEDVQKFALMKLGQLLEEYPQHLKNLLTISDAIDPLIHHVIDVLLKSCKELNPDLHGLVGKCLGQLGAIDPGRIENSQLKNYTEVATAISLNIPDSKFAFEVINELCRSFLAASNTRAQDCAAYALQEVLLYYEVTDEQKQTPGYLLWTKFPKSTQELLYPHLRSKYVNATSYNWSKHTCPLYGSAKGSSYREWVCSWTNYLIYHLGDVDCAKVFKPCMSIIKHDIRVALFMLPYVVLNTILLVDNHNIYLEVVTILKEKSQGPISPEYISTTQTMFSVLDFLRVWSNTHASGSRNTAVPLFLESIPKDTLATCSFNCNALFRSLMYYEHFIGVDQKDMEQHLPFLQKIYYSLDDPDGIAGVAATRQKTTSLRELVIEHESSGNLRDAVTCYERAIQKEPDNLAYHTGLLKCLIGLGELNIALMDVSGVMNKRTDWHSELNKYQAEISWRLGQWDNLSSCTSSLSSVGEDKSNWSVSLGTLLLSLKEKHADDFSTTLKNIRRTKTQCVLNATLESGGYQRAYDSIVCLHMLEDIEACSQLRFSSTSSTLMCKNLIESWDGRLDLMEYSFKCREPILNLQRVLIGLLQEEKELQIDLDNCWLRTAKMARKNGLFQTAHSCLLNVNDSDQIDILMEKATWHARLKDLHKALLTLQRESTSNVQCHNATQKRAYEGKKSLLKAEWMEQTEYYEPQVVLTQYKDAVEKHPTWEKGHFCLAKYYEKLMGVWKEETHDRKKSRKEDLIKFVTKHYGLSLRYGSKYIYQSMPRLLTLWLDFGAQAQQVLQQQDTSVDANKSSEKSYFKTKIAALNEDVEELCKSLPPYQFLTAFSQLVSRICHLHKGVWDILRLIICKIFCSYQQQAIWSLIAVSKSSIQKRSERCQQIFHELCSIDPKHQQFIKNALDLADQLVDVSNRRSKETKMSMEKDFPKLHKMLKEPNFSSIIVPLQETLTVKLSSMVDPKQSSSYNPFSENLPTIVGVDDVVEVLSSLQKPKKIKVSASDGRFYTLMCKPKDDLRKDARLMEFNSLVNKLLLNDPDCRRRQLHIRTYAVIPLNEECGLLEWVPQTHGLRHILNKIYKEKGLFTKVQDLKQLYDPMKSATVKQKVEIFVNRVLPRYPPIFHLWYLTTFPDPSKWYMARLAYCRTTAVISMVGYILGLGDRHGENILFDALSGDCVHVDFNCLFNKGDTFDCPEVVPFRLTHNLVNAMGPLGSEGQFRRSCEVTMKLMRNQKDSLLSVLNTFVYDPLVEWKKEARKRGNSHGDSTNEMALKILKDVSQRLSGFRNIKIQLPLSIEGQVHQLIKDATDVNNLAQMYIGWAAYM